MRLGDYEVLSQVASGPDAVAYRARDLRTDRPVELRVIAPNGVDGRWETLAKRIHIAELLEDPASRRILAFRDDHTPAYLAVEHADGTSLDDLLRVRSSLPVALVETILADLTSAVAEAHRMGLSHGRIQAGTILMNESNQPRLDFTGLDLGEGPAPPAFPADDIAGLGRVLKILLAGNGSAPVEAESPGAPETLDSWVASPSRETSSYTLAGLARAMTSDDPSSRPTALEIVAILDRRRSLAAGPIGTETTDSSFSRGPIQATRHDDPDEEKRLDFSVGPVGSRGSSGVPGVDDRDCLGRYRLLERIGQGGMGAVYRARDESDGTIVALKVLRPEWAASDGAFRRFQKEARLLGEVNNPFVTNLLEVNEDRGIAFLVLEYVSGRSLGQLLAERKNLPEAEALAILADVARALTDAHEKGIVHRDVKPDNILLAGGETPGLHRVKLSDFGLARHVVEQESLQVTRARAVVGTPQYMAPEQGGGGDVDPRADVYAMGVTLYQALSGVLPFAAERLGDLIEMHRREPLPSIRKHVPSASDGVCRILEKATAKAPGARYADASALLADIDRLLRGEPTPETAHPRLPKGASEDILRFDFSWDLEASPRDLWPLVANTERINQAIGLPAVTFRTEADPATGLVRRFGEARQGGLVAEWEEHAYEWVEPKRMGVLREYTRGPFVWMMSAVDLSPSGGGGTTLTHRLRIAPRGLFMRAAASLKVGRDSKKALERVYRRIDASLAETTAGGGAADPFLAPPPLASARRRRLDRLLDRLAGHGLSRPVIDALGEFLASAPDQEVARIRPLALARRLRLEPSRVVSACLHGARDGLLVMLWDLLCPLCRVPSEVVDTLKALRDHGRCEACGLDYELDFARSVEMIFRVHPEIRDADLGVYCIGGPSHSPHVVAQVRVEPGERIELDLGLSEGTYRVRGPQLPHAREIRVEPSGAPRKLEMDLEPGAVATERVSLRAGAQTLALSNRFDRELVVRVERTASRDDALTAARASSLALFRELFPGEILSPGQLVGVSAMTILVTALEETDALYSGLGDAGAFAVMHEHFLLLEERIRREGGALIKTVGEGGLAAFADSASAVRVGLAMGEILASGERTAGLKARAAIHRGPAIAATINNHLDYFGLSVARASALLRAGGPSDLLLSEEVAADPAVMVILRAMGMEPEVVPVSLPGLPAADAFRLRSDPA